MNNVSNLIMMHISFSSLTQEMMLRAQMQQQQIHDNPPSSQGIVISQSMEMPIVADPFLGQSNVTANHIKQESSDSGVGKCRGSSL